MKIAIAAVDKKENAQISERGGQAPCYLIFDERGNLLEMIDNPFCVGGGGAGFAVAKMLADIGVDVFIAGAIGDNMQGALQARQIRYCPKTGIASRAAKEIENNEK